MNKYLIFGGTTEGVQLARELSQAGHQVTVCVASDYGALMLEGIKAAILTGRMNAEQMEALMKKHGFSVVLDATHPYAVEVTENICMAASQAGMKCERIHRPNESVIEKNEYFVSDCAEAVEMLNHIDGNILLTTGSKDLGVFTGVSDYQFRVWVRILASEASLKQALTLGYPPNHIIAMHGPFSKELNAAMIHQFSIETMVTKQSGRAGGFLEKVEAAKETNTTIVVIERPGQENGISVEEAIQKYR